MHGTPGSRLLYRQYVDDATKRGIRLVGYDRAGYGGSSPLPGRKIAHVAEDVAAIADCLGVERFAVWGISGGGPHALACAALLSKRVVAASALASPAPYPSTGLDWLAGQGDDNVEEFRASMAGEEALDSFLTPLREEILKSTPEDFVKIFATLLPAVDRSVLSGGLGEYLNSSNKEGLRPGIAGWKDDDLAFVSDWGFDLSGIAVPLLLWQGRHDKMVPFAHGEWLARHIRQAEASLTDEDGHLTLYEWRIPKTHEWLMKHF